jgi:hypothetical protein
LNHVAESSSSSPLPQPITGIKQEVSCEDYDDDSSSSNYLTTTAGAAAAVKREDENYEHARNRISAKKSKRTNKRKEKLSLKKSAALIRAAPNVIVEPISVPRNAPQVQSESHVIDKRLLLQSQHLSRDERLSVRKLQLRHVLNQYRGANQMQQTSTEQFRMQFDKTCVLLKMLDRTKEKM